MDGDAAKHLELVQDVINRMAGNSFLLKGWAITLVAALVALAEKDSNVSFAVLALFPVLSFWGLDAYYLRQERLFRRLYEDVCASCCSCGESEYARMFSMDTSKYEDGVACWLQTMLSPTLTVLYGVIVALITAIIVGVGLGS